MYLRKESNISNIQKRKNILRRLKHVDKEIEKLKKGLMNTDPENIEDVAKHIRAKYQDGVSCINFELRR